MRRYSVFSSCMSCSQCSPVFTVSCFKRIAFYNTSNEILSPARSPLLPPQWSLLSFMHPLWSWKHNTCHSWLSSSVVFYFDVPGSTGAGPLYTWCLRIHTEQMMRKTKVLISTHTLAGTKMSMCQCGKVEETNKWKPKCSKEKNTFIHQTINK